MNESKVCSNASKKWLVVRSFSAFLVALVISFSIVSVSPSLTAYAAETGDSVSYPELPIPEDSSYIYRVVLLSSAGSSYYVVFTPTPDLVNCNSILTSPADKAVPFVLYDYQGDGEWSVIKEGITSSSFWPIQISSINIISSNYDIYYEGTDEVFFSAPKIPVLQEVMLTAQTVNPLAQIVGLLPLLIPFLVGLAAFWKGLRFLFSLLRKV